MAKRYIGKTICPGCQEELIWRESDTGSISAFCQLCDYQSTAKTGTPAKASLMRAMGIKDPGHIPTPPAGEKPSHDNSGKPAPAPASPKPSPAAKKPFGPFGL